MIYILTHYVILFAVFVFFLTYVKWTKKRTVKYIDKWMVLSLRLFFWLNKEREKYVEREPAVSIVFYELTGQKELDMAIIKVSEKKKYGFVAKDQFGNEAAIEAPTWALSDPALADLTVSEDGLSVELAPKGQVGECKLQLAVDAKIGPEQAILNGELPITLIAGEAVTVELKEV